MSQPPHSPSRLEQDSAPAPTRRGLRWRAAANAFGVGGKGSAHQGGAQTWSADSPSRRLVDLLRAEPGYRIGFLDDPAGRGGRLAGELLSRERGVFLYGLNVGRGLTVPSYEDGCFDLIVSAGDAKHWSQVSRTLGDVARLVRPGGIIAVITSQASVVSRGMRRLAKPSSAGTDPRDAHDIAVGTRLVEILGSSSRTEQLSRVVWQATREVSG